VLMVKRSILNHSFVFTLLINDSSKV
jgi:hypothetical protein